MTVDRQPSPKRLKGVNSFCPFCNAGIKTDAGVVVRYACGAMGSRKTGTYTKMCDTVITTQQGAL